MDSGKPPNIVERMVHGRLQKFFEEQCLLDQKFVMDDSKSVQTVVDEVGKSAALPLKVTGFVRVQTGEGLAEEVQEEHVAGG